MDHGRGGVGHQRRLNERPLSSATTSSTTREISRKKFLAPFLGVLVLVACEQAADHLAGPSDSTAEPAAPALGLGPSAKPMVLRLLGTDTETVQAVPDPHDLIPGGDLASCYTVDLIDVPKDRTVGTATDCISVLGLANGGVQVVGTTIFDFGGGHTFTTQGLTSVQPTTHGSPAITHITGAIPTPGSNGVIAGAGRFEGFAAEARLSGAVNLTSFPASAAFDCLFVVVRL